MNKHTVLIFLFLCMYSLFDVSHLVLLSITYFFSSSKKSKVHHHIIIEFIFFFQKKTFNLSRSIFIMSVYMRWDEDKRCVKKAEEIFKLDKHKLCWIRRWREKKRNKKKEMRNSMNGTRRQVDHVMQILFRCGLCY